MHKNFRSSHTQDKVDNIKLQQNWTLLYNTSFIGPLTAYYQFFKYQ